ncbi:hypothetical protein [Mucisphaera sp.]|uniref:hypothetical protein n=1 Tax=Mucisphaera sp. TaxID=2913024 RepID=UPI003D0F7273
MYNLFEAAISAITPSHRTIPIRVHVEAQLTREPLAGARVRVNAGPWVAYEGPDKPIETTVAAGRRIRVEVSKRGWIDPRPSAWMDGPDPDGIIRIGMM